MSETVERAPAPATAGSGTRRNSGIENSAHHTATLRKDRREACPASRMPNVDGERIQATFSASSRPPPRYPRAKPAVEMRSISSSRARCGRNES